MSGLKSTTDKSRMKLLMKGKAMMTVDAYPCSSELEEAAKRLYSAAGFLSLHVAKANGLEEKTSE